MAQLVRFNPLRDHFTLRLRLTLALPLAHFVEVSGAFSNGQEDGRPLAPTFCRPTIERVMFLVSGGQRIQHRRAISAARDVLPQLLLVRRENMDAFPAPRNGDIPLLPVRRGLRR